MKLTTIALLLFLVACNETNNINQLSDAISQVSEKMDTKIIYQDNLSPDLPTLSLEFKSKSEKYDLFESRLVYYCFEKLMASERQYTLIEVQKKNELSVYEKITLKRISELKGHSERYLNSLLRKTKNENLMIIDTLFLKANQFEEAEELIQEHITKIEFKGFKTGESQGVSMVQIYFSINSRDDLTYLVFNEKNTDFKLIGFGINP